MQEERKPAGQSQGQVPHNVIMENRKHMTVSGVLDIDSFSEDGIVLYTDLGELSVTGRDLHLGKLSVDTGELTLDGEIESLTYYDSQPREKGFFARIFK
ncbi:sporulation protein YabP [Acetanaerobacterium sp. MSJ-12]|uniref:Sporulation protein YabP n=1 Tax=Bittarella massiliensis (ex Durand et al. 2017) TaxID=1720313 RepID=A0AAW5KGS9_9FIRM|nr:MULTISPECIES: sporulation protein YabP [Oscillospiraceae]MBC2870272.1 sporulation protein YabP [Bittarella massiliensis (ex Durand et al. 2017)]MBO1680004.1 sporulation protein YabP [Bittarella massiliensis (ex Durand et al. 2017)]MBU5420078.1 sporulation protein YabP [Acetanaerobacterium sp. MSJ-12]MCQ4950189.1 sporulation protein YabP [Bittarella massiliensis (ex Durand et al. 2017)]